jgi:hypothetical protein
LVWVHSSILYKPELPPGLLRRDLDPAARGVLRGDIPNYWAADQHALYNLTSGVNFQFLRNPSTFDKLAEENKFIVVALVRHVVDVLNRRYIRKEPGVLLDMYRFRKVHPILYVSTEAVWDELLRLASVPGADGARENPAARELSEFLKNGLEISGNLVDSRDLEQCLEYGRDYYEDVSRSASRLPVLDTSDLDSDDMHAFLCAYTTCFRPREPLTPPDKQVARPATEGAREGARRPWWRRIFE